MKTIAMYLPQFHQVPENDEWWGEGFTDWIATKQAKDLFEGHVQPHIPLEGYYDLLNKETMVRQAELMKRYSVDGLCIYHYWFKDGRQILEKPTENLLRWKDINMPFCFCWANVTWARSWSNISYKNVWSDIREENKEGNDGILLEQKYGGYKQWKAHFEYLLPFFKDDRYLKYAGKPIFAFYNTREIFCFNEMVDCWRNLAQENDLPGICVVGVNPREKTKKYIDLTFYNAPYNVLFKTQKIKKNGVDFYRYQDVWKNILEQDNLPNCVYGGFVSLDDTPRRGYRGRVIAGMTPKLFQEYLTELMAKNSANGMEYTFINAWNEWGEGMYMEPDKQYGYAVLEANLYAKENYKDRISKYNIQPKDITSAEYYDLKCQKEKVEDYIILYDQWLKKIETGWNLQDYFQEKNVEKIAIYGCGALGMHLYSQLKSSRISVEYFVDKESSSEILKTYKPEDTLPLVDMIVITAFYYYDEIKKKLEENNNSFKVISLESVIQND